MKVLVTRLVKDTEATAHKLVQLGHEPVSLPLTELRVLHPEIKTTHPDFLLFTSANGVAAVGDTAREEFKHLTAYAVGPKTADALAKRAYINIRQGSGDARGLTDLIVKDWRDKKFSGLYFCGEERSFDFKKALARHGQLELCEAYRIVELNHENWYLAELLEDVRGGAILIYSAGSARRLIDLLKYQDKLSLLRDCRIIAISANSASLFEAMEGIAVTIALEPTEAAMLSALKAIH